MKKVMEIEDDYKNKLEKGESQESNNAGITVPEKFEGMVVCYLHSTVKKQFEVQSRTGPPSTVEFEKIHTPPMSFF